MRRVDHDDAVNPEDEDRPPEFSWLDVLAFTIAAYQVLFPFVLALVGVGVIVYLALWLWAH